TIPPSRIGRSRLTGSPVSSPPRAVRASVSGPTSKRSRPGPRSTTVRQAPLTATLAPRSLSSCTRSADTTRRLPSRSMTRPISSIRPVNTGSDARCPGHAGLDQPVVAEGTGRDVGQADRITQPEPGPGHGDRPRGRAQSQGPANAGHPTPEPAVEDRAAEAAARLEQDRGDVEAVQPPADVRHVHPSLARPALQHRDSPR